MPVITLANTKGGAGKTTAALLLACEYARQGYKVAILDADPQKWITAWYDTGTRDPNLSVISEITPASLQTHIREMSAQVDFFIIDLPGQRDQLLATAMGLSDHVLIPVQGCAMDARGASQVLELLEQMKAQCGIAIAHSVVLTRVSSMVTTRALTGIKDILMARGVNVLETPIIERSAFRDIFETGTTLHNADPARVSNLDKARENARTLSLELKRLLPAVRRKPESSSLLSRFLARKAA
jgi:chromosome partitioning protein